MNEAKINGFQIVTDSLSIESKLKPDLDNFESRYRYLLRHTNLLYERNFQITMDIFITAIWLLLTFEKQHAWYSYILAAITLAGIWYVFYLTDRLRGSLKKVHQDAPILMQMRLRKDVLAQLSQLRNMTIIHASILLLSTWSFWSLEKRFSFIGIIILAIIFILPFAIKFKYAKRVKTTRIYLDNIIKVLEQ
jgi:hypothetical protein